jgi:hypothetical protein
MTVGIAQILGNLDLHGHMAAACWEGNLKVLQNEDVEWEFKITLQFHFSLGLEPQRYSDKC